MVVGPSGTLSAPSALIAVYREMFGTRNVIRSDREDLKVEAVEHAVVQDRRGVRVQFPVRNQCLGRVMNRGLSDATGCCVPEGHENPLQRSY